MDRTRRIVALARAYGQVSRWSGCPATTFGLHTNLRYKIPATRDAELVSVSRPPGSTVPTIAFTPHLRKHLRCADGPFAGETVRSVLESAFAEIPGLRGYLLDDRGRLRQHVAIFVGGRMIQDRVTQQDPVAPETEIFVFQALSGG